MKEKDEKEEKRLTLVLPVYRCIKDVQALKIGEVIYNQPDGTAFLVPEENGYPTVSVSAEYLTKHKPYVGGYYVLYKDGYESFSPAEAFEKGYVLKGEDKLKTIRAKFYCQLTEDDFEYRQTRVELSPVTNGGEENKSFSKYTPSGHLQMNISHETKACNFFAEGAEYYLDITEAPKEE